MTRWIGGLAALLAAALGGACGGGSSMMGSGCAWSGDRTLLMCTPASPLASRTTYATHMGGGMMSAGGMVVDYTPYGPGMGGQWIMGGMMTGTHGGMGWGMMGSGWRNANGSYGMVFTFTTA